MSKDIEKMKSDMIELIISIEVKGENKFAKGVAGELRDPKFLVSDRVKKSVKDSDQWIQKFGTIKDVNIVKSDSFGIYDSNRILLRYAAHWVYDVEYDDGSCENNILESFFKSDDSL